MLELISEKKQSLKEFTENNYAQASFFWNALLKSREIKVNGVRVSKDVLLKEGDVVQYYLTPKQAAKEAYFVRYSDENITVIDKASGVIPRRCMRRLHARGNITLSTVWIEIPAVCSYLPAIERRNKPYCSPFVKDGWRKFTMPCVLVCRLNLRIF